MDISQHNSIENTQDLEVVASFFTSFEQDSRLLEEDEEITPSYSNISLERSSSHIKDSFQYPSSESEVAESGSGNEENYDKEDEADQSNCPICLQAFQNMKFIVHNINEEQGTFRKFYIDDISAYLYPKKKVDSSSMVSRGRKRRGKSKQFEWGFIAPESSFTPTSSSGSQKTLSVEDRRRIYNQDLLPRDKHGGVRSARLDTIKIEPHQLDRLKPFLTRELLALISDAFDEVVFEYMQSLLLLPYHRNNSWNEVCKMLRPWLDQWTDRFVDELCQFAHSGMNITTWDRMVVYY
ncbi:hypothetical protein G9A89_018046 [Geosiphon pyriformis]|nr:hypothetical protein G9A89_018046 [Geosiphon pyriformis]